MSLLAEDKITSVQNGQEEQLPPVVDAAPPPQSEIIRHTGAQNRLDPVLYMQNMHSGSFTWSVNDPRGKLLFYKPIHPRAINPIMAHVSRMYNYWSGDVDFETKLGGTALQSGQIDIVELPPGVHPTTLAGTTDYMAYNWVGIDAKHQGMVGFTVRDVRQGAFHFMDQKQDKFTDNEVGGYYAVYVGIPLNTTSTGTQQIAVQIWSKPAQNFRMTKLRIPYDETVTSSIAPDDLVWALNWHSKPDELHPIGAGSFTAIDKVILGSNLEKVWKYVSPHHYDLTGTRFKSVSTFQAAKTAHTVGMVYTWKRSGDEMKDVVFKAKVKQIMAPHSETSTALISSPDGKVIYTGVSVGYDSKTKEITCSFNVGSQTAVNPENWAEKYVFLTENPLIAKQWITEVQVEAITLPTDEGFVYFTAEATKVRSLQTYEMARLFCSGRLRNWIPEGMCAQFVMFDVVEKLPVSAVKLWKEGFLTCAPKKDEVDYDIGGIRLNFSGFVPRTSPPERTAEMSKNTLLLRAARSSK